MKKCYSIFLFILIVLNFNACDLIDHELIPDNIKIDVKCVPSASASDIESYITLESGDIIKEEESGTKVSIYHTANGVRKVCLDSGKAHIVRN